MNSEHLQTRIGFASERGKRESNDDFVVMHESEVNARGVTEAVAAIADGISGPGGRLAAETVARGFLDGYLSQPPTLGDRKSVV